ncbi:MAG: biopolymer transporter ExbD [Phycisphaerae bacterium]|jgi:biopolymer transport protein ExbD|nr:biopolymer transporter ExbD [Phycisphaerae bacterium]
MRFSKPRKQSLQLNLTSMLDVVLQLIIFFIMVTNFAAADLPDLEPPEATKAFESDYPHTRIVNIVPDKSVPGKAKHVLVGGRALTISESGMNTLTNMLKAEQEKRPDEKLQVRLRVDRSVHFKEVQPVMQAITGARIARVNLVAYMTDE